MNRSICTTANVSIYVKLKFTNFQHKKRDMLNGKGESERYNGEINIVMYLTIVAYENNMHFSLKIFPSRFRRSVGSLVEVKFFTFDKKKHFVYIFMVRNAARGGLNVHSLWRFRHGASTV